MFIVTVILPVIVAGIIIGGSFLGYDSGSLLKDKSVKEPTTQYVTIEKTPEGVDAP